MPGVQSAHARELVIFSRGPNIAISNNYHWDRRQTVRRFIIVVPFYDGCRGRAGAKMGPSESARGRKVNRKLCAEGQRERIDGWARKRGRLVGENSGLTRIIGGNRRERGEKPYVLRASLCFSRLCMYGKRWRRRSRRARTWSSRTKWREHMARTIVFEQRIYLARDARTNH